MRALPELIEAAARSGDTQVASDALNRLAETTRAAGTDFGLGIEARSSAQVSQGETAERLYGEAVARLGCTQLRPELTSPHAINEAAKHDAFATPVGEPPHAAWGPEITVIGPARHKRPYRLPPDTTNTARQPAPGPDRKPGGPADNRGCLRRGTRGRP